MKVKILDCTLRDGAYIVNANFGKASIRGIVDKLNSARIDIIEVGWLKNDAHKVGTTYYHIPQDFANYLNEKKENTIYTAMIDYNRYDIDSLPQNDGKYIDAIRIVFPYGKYKEGIEIGKKILDKGYNVYYQLANTLNYTNDDLKIVVDEFNKLKPSGIYMVDTFGAMIDEDVERIATFINQNLDKDIDFGIHTHNNQQLAFSNTTVFLKTIEKMNIDREVILDASLCGMGRGAGNATTELIVNYLNRKYDTHYDLDEVMDAIDLYMNYYKEHFAWGYSTEYFIAGIYTTHVNNIAYLLNNHNTSAKDMRNIIESMGEKERRAYDYDYLENKYIENQNKTIDDTNDMEYLKKEFADKDILLIAPGKTSQTQKDKIISFIKEHKPIVIGVNAILDEYDYDYILFVNKGRFEYSQNSHRNKFKKTKKILLSNIKVNKDNDKEYILSYSHAIKRGFMHFDNAVISALRLFDYMGIKNIYLSGFDGFKEKYNESYADVHLPSLNVNTEWGKLNDEIKSMYNDVIENKKNINVTFLTESIFND